MLIFMNDTAALVLAANYFVVLSLAGASYAAERISKAIRRRKAVHWPQVEARV
jgi:hypothetical protein